MRVISGKYRGRVLSVPKGGLTRPTSDRVREALFSVLDDSFRDGKVLDLFAGSGALGIEAVSRGAAWATFVERSPAALKAIKRNLSEFDLEKQTDVFSVDVRRYLKSSAARDRRYGLVFIDPPYRFSSEYWEALNEQLPDLLERGARVVCESARSEPLSLTLPLAFERYYGSTLIRIYHSESM